MWDWLGIEEINFSNLKNLEFAAKFLLLWAFLCLVFIGLRFWHNPSSSISDNYRFPFGLFSLPVTIFRKAQETGNVYLYLVSFAVFAVWIIALGYFAFWMMENFDL